MHVWTEGPLLCGGGRPSRRPLCSDDQATRGRNQVALPIRAAWHGHPLETEPPAQTGFPSRDAMAKSKGPDAGRRDSNSGEKEGLAEQDRQMPWPLNCPHKRASAPEPPGSPTGSPSTAGIGAQSQYCSLGGSVDQGAPLEGGLWTRSLAGGRCWQGCEVQLLLWGSGVQCCASKTCTGKRCVS